MNDQHCFHGMRPNMSGVTAFVHYNNDHRSRVSLVCIRLVVYIEYSYNGNSISNQPAVSRKQHLQNT